MREQKHKAIEYVLIDKKRKVNCAYCSNKAVRWAFTIKGDQIPVCKDLHI